MAAVINTDAEINTVVVIDTDIEIDTVADINRNGD